MSVLLLIISTIREEAYFIDPDGGYVVVHSILHMGNRTDVVRFYPSEFDTTDVLYVNTGRYSWTGCVSPDSIPGKCMIMKGGRFYSIMEKRTDTIYLKKLNDSTYEFSNIIGSYRIPYDRMYLFFLLPTGYKFVEYSSQAQGEWSPASNMLKFYGEKINKTRINLKIAKTKPEKVVSKQETLHIPVPEEIVETTVVQKNINVHLKPRIYFPLGSYTLNEEGRKIAGNLYNKLDFDKFEKLIIIGYTDSLPFRKGARGPVSSNWDLSALRASRVARYLIELGAPPEKLEIRGLSEHKPAAPNSTPDARARNRRVEFMIKLPADENR